MKIINRILLSFLLLGLAACAESPIPTPPSYRNQLTGKEYPFGAVHGHLTISVALQPTDGYLQGERWETKFTLRNDEAKAYPEATVTYIAFDQDDSILHQGYVCFYMILGGKSQTTTESIPRPSPQRKLKKIIITDAAVQNMYHAIENYAITGVSEAIFTFE